MEERDRKELSRLIGSAIRRMKEASVNQYEKGMRTFMLVAANYERMILASFVRGVLDEVEVDHRASREIEAMIKVGKYAAARELMVLAINQKMALSVHLPGPKRDVSASVVVEASSDEVAPPPWVAEIESKAAPPVEFDDVEFEGDSEPEVAGEPLASGSFIPHPRCSVCGEPQFDTPAGLTCSTVGHGGAPSLLPGQEPSDPASRSDASSPTAGSAGSGGAEPAA